METRLNKLEDAFMQELKNLDLERDSLKSLYRVKMDGGFWRGKAL